MESKYLVTKGLSFYLFLALGLFSGFGQSEEHTQKRLKYCIDPNWMPYEAIRDGRHIGLSSDYIKLLASTSGIEFELVVTSSWNQSLTFLQAGNCDLVPFLNYSEDRSEYLEFSDSFFEAPNVLVSTKDKPFLQGLATIGEQTLAVPRGYRLVEFMAINHPQIALKLVNSESEGLDMVADNDVDFFVGSMLSVNNYIRDNQLNNLKIAGWGGPQDQLRIGILKKHAPLLAKLNQAIANISVRQHAKIYERWGNLQIITEQNYTLVWQTALIASVILILLFFRTRAISGFNRKLQVKNDELELLKKRLEMANSELEFLSNHDPLTNLYNRHFFNRLVEKEMRHPDAQESCLIIVDIDLFKQVNDEYGHSAGDQILKEFSTILKQAVRETDIVARWGGEEFIIISQHSNFSDAKRLCQRITQNISEFHFSDVGSVTASFGISQLQAGETIMACFDRADKALYEAKSKGRDTICLG